MCETCGARYTIGQFLVNSGHYFPLPHDYKSGCQRHCLACWLGVGPRDFPASEGDDGSSPLTYPGLSSTGGDGYSIDFDAGCSGFAETDEPEGDLLREFEAFLEAGCNLVVMPIARVHLEWWALSYPRGVTFYPPGWVNLEASASSQFVPTGLPSQSVARRHRGSLRRCLRLILLWCSPADSTGKHIAEPATVRTWNSSDRSLSWLTDFASIFCIPVLSYGSDRLPAGTRRSG